MSQLLLLYKVWGYYNKFDYEILGGILLICQNAMVWVCRAWIRIFFVWCPKTNSTLNGLVLEPPLVHDGPPGAPAFLKFAYCSILFFLKWGYNLVFCRYVFYLFWMTHWQFIANTFVSLVTSNLRSFSSLTHLPWTKWPSFRRHFQTLFLEWKC